MTQQEQNPQRARNSLDRGIEVAIKSPLRIGMNRPIPVNSYFARAMEAVTLALLQAEVKEHGRLTREGMARAKAKRLSARRDCAAATRASDERP